MTESTQNFRDFSFIIVVQCCTPCGKIKVAETLFFCQTQTPTRHVGMVVGVYDVLSTVSTFTKPEVIQPKLFTLRFSMCVKERPKNIGQAYRTKRSLNTEQCSFCDLVDLRTARKFAFRLRCEVDMATPWFSCLVRAQEQHAPHVLFFFCVRVCKNV